MGFIVAAVGAIASAISGVASFVAGLGALGSALVTIGLNVAVGYITKKLSKKKQEQAGGVQIERQYGADVSRQVAMGVVGIAGHDCYINTYGSSNKYLQQIYAISDFYTSGLNRIAINGSWVGLGTTADPQKGFPVTTGDFAGFIWVKFVDGRQTAADSYLVDNSNPSGRWTADCVGLGMSYILVSMTFDKDKNNQFPDFFFEFKGAPLYDWRKDSSVGGSGPHRWNDVSTWEFSENPIVMSYNYRRGLSINGDMFCGMGMSASDLPLDKWTVAANLCDEIKADGLPAYRCSIMIDCMQTHGTTIEALGVSCAALHVDGVSGSWPIVGSAQPTVVTITDADLVDVVHAPRTFRARRSMADLVNSVSGNFPDPDSLWSMIGYEPQISQAGLVLDRRTRDVNIDFPQVRHPRQAASLAWIYLYENRFEANAQITLRAKFRGLEPGDWIRWNSELYGDRVYVITDASLKSVDDDEMPRCVQVSLQERDGSIYDNVSPPPIVTPFPPGLPQYLQEVQNLQVLPIYMLGDSGILVPAIRVSWSVIEDETVSDVLIRYWPTEQPENVVITRANGRLVVPLTEGVVGSTEYQVQTRLETDPARVTAWTAPKTVVTYAGEDQSPVDWEQIAEDVQSAIEFATDNVRDLISWSQNLQASFSDMQLSQYIDMQTIRRELSSSVGRASARFIEEITVATGPNSAIVQSLTQLQAELAEKAGAEVVELMQAKVDEIDGEVNAIATALMQVNASADGQVSSGLFRMTAQAGSGGFTTRIAMFARSGTAAAYQQAGMFINVSPSQSQIMFLASQFIIADPSNFASVVAPFVVQGGIVYMQNVRLGTLQFDELRSNNGKLIIRGSGNLADIRIFV